ncbi:MAG: N-acetyl-gamma-glutamyl-phosphate reductase [Gammaproteobacteria bacterium]|nr:N-acetyl-gamma-glutamyl-phosphate reductase [Gammaproteobacteria bacterium]
MRIRVGVMGASGYMGGEVIRILLMHPLVKIVWATSRQGGDIAIHHPNLYGSDITLIHPDNISAVDVVFMALPTEASIEETAKLLATGCKVIDLGAAFRLQNRTDWEQVYQQTHGNWSLVEQAVYGINELHQQAITSAQLVANPGCFASAAILALTPLIEAGLIDCRNISITGISGTAGAGAELSRAAHHPEIGNNLIAYNVVNHRHSYEMEQELSAISSTGKVRVQFTPVYAPITRGILNVCHTLATADIDRNRLLELYRDYYRMHPFTRIYDMPAVDGVSWNYRPYPWVSAVAGSNYCHLGLDIDAARNSIVILAALDSIGKGGAQVAIENMNLMMGLPRECGLQAYGRHPA